MILRFQLCALLVAFTVFGAACGDDDDAVDVAEDTTTIQEPDETDTTEPEPEPDIEGPVNDEGTEAVSGDSVTVEMIDFAFDPTFLTGAPSTVTVQLDNTGEVPHTFTIESLDVDEVLDPGQQAEVTVELPPDGDDIEFICRFHVAQGMKGAFVAVG